MGEETGKRETEWGPEVERRESSSSPLLAPRGTKWAAFCVPPTDVERVWCELEGPWLSAAPKPGVAPVVPHSGGGSREALSLERGEIGNSEELELSVALPTCPLLLANDSAPLDELATTDDRAFPLLFDSDAPLLLPLLDEGEGAGDEAPGRGTLPGLAAPLFSVSSSHIA